MKKIFLIWLVIFLIGQAVVATTNDVPIYTFIIKLESSDPGDKLQAAEIKWLKDTDEQIALVNAGYGEFYVEIYNDPTVWQMVNYLKKQSGTAILDSNQMNLTLDAALNLARYQNTVRLFRDKGLKRLAFRYIPDRGPESMIRVYYVHYEKGGVSNGKDTVYTSTTQFLVAKCLEHEEPAQWDLGCGLEWTAVSDGRPIFVPALSLTRSKSYSELSLTGGYFPTGENDFKFFAGSAAYFPRGNNFGLLARIIYTSEAVETYGAYVQQGFGPTAGIVWRQQALSLYLTGGLQYFDRQRQDRRAEATINAGLNFKAITF